MYSMLSFMLERSRNKMHKYLLIIIKNRKQQHRKNQLANKKRWLLTRDRKVYGCQFKKMDIFFWSLKSFFPPRIFLFK